MEDMMVNEQATCIGSTNLFEECSHHWVIQDGDGPTSAGVCRLCGALKEFKNYMEASLWGDDKSKSDPRPNLLGRPSKSRILLEDEEDF